jgi:hypothetical protein
MKKNKTIIPKKSAWTWGRRKGIGTLEVVIIIAVLLTVALIFRQSITAYAKNLMTIVFNDQNAIDDLSADQQVG